MNSIEDKKKIEELKNHIKNFKGFFDIGEKEHYEYKIQQIKDKYKNYVVGCRKPIKCYMTPSKKDIEMPCGKSFGDKVFLCPKCQAAKWIKELDVSEVKSE